MKIEATTLAGVFVIDLERHVDARGWFARTWCAEEFTRAGLDPCVAQCSSSFNAKRGTLRGMHYQAAPHEEAKLVRCVRGAMFDVALDLREGSPTRHEWIGVELTADNGRALYLPAGIAHGFQTLDDDTEIFYMISRPFHAASARGVRFDDPAFGIQWPLETEAILSPRDGAYPLLKC